ncbi:MAG: esterase-like activity of phytase family protein [Paracoccaceae bacterium]
MTRWRRSGLALGVALALAALAMPGRTEAPLPPLWRTDLKPLDAEGLSALWMAPGGGRLLALSDRGFVLSAEVGRDAERRITSVTEQGRWPVRLPRKAGAREVPLDTEGIALGRGGAIFVSTEGPARILRMDSPGTEARAVAGPDTFGKLHPNGALEALAIGPDGALYTLPETPNVGTTGYPLYRRAGREWSVLTVLPAQGGMVPVGADVGPDGRLYLLYRDFSPLRGFASLLQRHTLGPDGVGAAETLLHSGYGKIGNLEGVSVWRAADGGLVASMVSDDNGLFLQDAELIEMHLPD